MILSLCGWAIGDLTATMTLTSNPPSQFSIVSAFAPLACGNPHLKCEFFKLRQSLRVTRRGRFKIS